jgi:hypothetical protein
MIKAAYDFSLKAKIDLISYLDRIEVFFKEGYPQIVDYFNGISTQIDQKYINELSKLTELSLLISTQFKILRDSMHTVDYWELLDMLEDVRLKLWTTTKLPKYLRTSRTNYDYSKAFKFTYSMGNGETLEKISKGVLSSNNYENDWTEIALKNDLSEIDWDIDGGEQIELFRESFQQNIVTSMVDFLIGERVYGLDLDKKLTFVNNDLKVLTYKETAEQSASILGNLKRGDIPEFQSMGVNEAFTVGNNIASLTFSTVIREMKRNFDTDNLFVDFNVKKISYNNGDLTIEWSVGTKYELIINKTTTV